jgi:hypothetical protein
MESKLITGTNLEAVTVKSISVNEDAVFEQLFIDGVDRAAAMNLVGNTITATMYLRAPAGSWITGIKLASGSVMIY